MNTPSIDTGKTYKVSGKQLFDLNEYVGQLYVDIGYWRRAICDAISDISIDPLSAMKFVAAISKLASRMQDDMLEWKKAELKQMAFSMASEPIGDAEEGGAA